MGDIVLDGTIRAAYVPSIANLSAPTLAELAAGFVIHQWLTIDGLAGFEAATQAVSTSSLAGITDTELPGRDKYSGAALTLKRQTSGDLAYSTLVRGVAGFIVVRRWLWLESVAFASAQQVGVYPGTCGTTVDIGATDNVVAKYTVPWFMSATPQLRALIA